MNDWCRDRWRFLRGVCLAVVLCLTAMPALGDGSVDENVEADVVENGKGVIVTINKEISDVTTESITRRVDQAIEDGAKTIIFEIDTPGGYVTSALDICNYIKNLGDVKTVAWVHSQAYSAGSMISAACDEIVMSSASVIGDCGVILGGPTGPQEVPEGIRAKAESPVLEQFRDSAARNGYETLLCESMVRSEMEVWWIENTKTGEKRFVETEEKEELVDGLGEKRKILGLELPDLSGGDDSWKLVESYHDSGLDKSMPVDQPVVKSTELLTMSQSRAYAFGFSKGIVSGEEDLRERYGLAGPIERLKFTGLEVFTRWMTSMGVRMFLLVIVLVGAYVEFNTPGVGVAGLVALIALGIFLGAPFLTGLANIWEVLLILAGFALLAVEIFVIPGFGIAGISGLLLLFVGLVFTFMPDSPGRLPIYWPRLDESVLGLKNGIQAVGASMVVSVVAMAVLARYLPTLPYFRRIVPANPTPSDVAVADVYHGAARVGDFGVVVSGLRPSGKVRFGSTLVDVVSECEMIDAGEQVEVVEHHGNRIVVRRSVSV